MIPAKTCFSAEDLTRYWNGELSADQSANVEQHLAECSICLDQLRLAESRDPFCQKVVAACASKAALSDSDMVLVNQRFAGLVAHDTPLSVGSAAETAVPSSIQTKLPSIDFLSPPQQPDELGRLGHYRILQIIGKGGMGIVFRAEDISLQRQVALKVMLPKFANDPDAKERFLREARSAATIERDHVVPIYFVGEERGIPFLAMQLLQGETLENRLIREQKLPIAEVLRIGREICEGLAAAHERRLIHRDIKPANIWLETPHVPPSQGRKEALSIHPLQGGKEGGGRIKLLDFGLARPVEEASQLTSAHVVLGTPAYMSPEQANGEPLDARSDLFSLGSVLYALCTGQLPFTGTKTLPILQAVTHHQPAPPRELNPEVPKELCNLMMRLLAKHPAQRPESARAVAGALAAIEAHPACSSVSPKRKKSRQPWAIAASILAGLTLLAGIVIYWQTPDGLVRIEADDSTIKVAIDDGELKVVGAYKEPLSIKPGKHGLKITRGDFAFDTDKLMVNKGDTTLLRIEIIYGRMQIVQDSKVIAQSERLQWEPVPPGKSPLDALDANTIPAEERFDWQPKEELVAVLGSHRQRHWEGVYSVDISPDGKWVVAGSGHAGVMIWDFDMANPIGPVDGWRYPKFSPDGRKLFSGFDSIYDLDHCLDAWKKDPSIQPKDAKTNLPSSRGYGEPRTPQFSDDGTLFVLGDINPERVTLWRIGNTTQKIIELHDFHSPAISHDGGLLALVHANDATVHLFDVLEDKIQERESLPKDEAKAARVHEGACSLHFTHDGRLGVLTPDRKSITFWLVSGSKSKNMGQVTFENFQGSVRFAAKAPRMLAYSNRGYFLSRLTENGANQETRENWPEFQNNDCKEVAIFADGKRLVSCHYNGAVFFWEWKDGKLVQRNALVPQPARSEFSYENNINFSPSAEFLTTDGEMGGTIWHFGDKSPKGFDSGRITGCGFFSRNECIGRDREQFVTLRLGPNDTKEIWKPHMADRVLTSAKACTKIVLFRNPFSKKMAGQVFDMKDFAAAPGPVFDIANDIEVSALSEDGRVLTCSTKAMEKDSTRICVFDIQDKKAVPRYDFSNEFRPARIRLSPDGHFLVAWTNGPSAAIWHLESAPAKLHHSAEGIPGNFSPDGKFMAFIAEDKRRLEIREVANWKLLWSRRLQPMNDAVFAPDGRHLLVANGNQTAYILRLDPIIFGGR